MKFFRRCRLEEARMRNRAQYVVENKWLTRFIMCLILLNAFILGLETNRGLAAETYRLIGLTDRIILIIFSLEILTKIWVFRVGFFTRGWNIFDFIIIGVSWLPLGESFAVLRAMRMLRTLRLISMVPSMRKIIDAMAYAIPGMLSVTGLLLLIYYVGSVMATNLFGHHPNADLQQWFGNIGSSAFSLFQIMTLESWAMGIVRPVMEVFPWAWAFFIPFIVLTSFAVLNLFIGIVVDAMNAINEQRAQDSHKNNEQDTQHALAAMQIQIRNAEKHIADIKKLLIDSQKPR